MNKTLKAIAEDDRRRVEELLKADTLLVTRLVSKATLYQSKIFHWLYVGDTALHLAAAGYRVEIVGLLLRAGADPRHCWGQSIAKPAADRVEQEAAVRLKADREPVVRIWPQSRRCPPR